MLILQLFRIDTNGCMKIIRERRADAARPQQVSYTNYFWAVPIGVLTKIEAFQWVWWVGIVCVLPGDLGSEAQ